MDDGTLSRRVCCTAAGRAAIVLPFASVLGADAKPPTRPLRIGLCADVHKDVIHNADDRLRAFVAQMRKDRADLVMQLGDFCQPIAANREFLKIFQSFPGPHYHVLGNHDTDGGFTRAQTCTYWGIKAPYYSFDAGGFHLVVLDGNDKHKGRAPGYPRYIGKTQAQWLAKDLAAAELPTLLFSHQSLEAPTGVENAAEVRAILEAANKQAGRAKVVAAFSGHHHMDYHTQIRGIHYVQINSMSYKWVGEKYKRTRFDAATEKAHPWVKFTIPYRDPLWALLTADAKGTLTITGRRSTFMPPGPKEIGLPKPTYGGARTASIEDRKLTFPS